MRWVVLCTTFCVLVLGAACHKNPAPADSSNRPAAEAAPPAPPQDAAGAAAPAPVAAPAPRTPAPATVRPKNALTPIAGIVDPQMTSRLRQFMTVKGRFPQSLLEMGGATGDSMPRPPAGGMFVIDQATAEVKIVKQ